jgi:hypothetical protein
MKITVSTQPRFILSCRLTIRLDALIPPLGEEDSRCR